MIDNFLLLKLNRSVWISLLYQKKIVEAISYFETYMNNLAMFQADKKLKDSVVEESATSIGYFLAKMTTAADIYFEDKDYSNALLCYTAIFKYKQNDVNILRNYIKCLEELEQFDLVVELIEYSEKFAQSDASMYKFLAEVYYKRNNLSKAVEFLEKYFSLKQSDITPNEYNLLGCYYNKLYSDMSHNDEDIFKSLKNFEVASDLEPYNKLYAKNVTIMASKANDAELGRKYWDRILEIGNMTNDDKYDYAAYCLKNKDFKSWYEYFDFRFKKENNATAFPKINKPKWDGVKDLSNSTLLVYYEQGFGDTFLMWGYFRRLVKLAKHVIFVVQDSVASLLKNNDLGVEIIPKSMANLNKIKFDYYIPSMSVPIALKLDESNISVGEGYLKVNQEIVEDFREKYFNNDKFKIGIAFSGSPNGNHTRDISIESFLPLDKLKNVEIYSLTKDIPDSKFECFEHNKVHNLAKEFKNFEDTAAAVENLDVVITSDNCILNLAGALGKKTLGLFNWHHEFRWFDLTGDNTVWLTSVKPFINDKTNNWTYSMNLALQEVEKIRNSQTITV